MFGERHPARVVAVSDGVVPRGAVLGPASARTGLGAVSGAFVPRPGMAVVSTFGVHYRLPISGELGVRKRAA
jgi:hypothetical protein